MKTTIVHFEAPQDRGIVQLWLELMMEIGRKTYCETRTKGREKLQAEIGRLNTDRNKGVAKKSQREIATNPLDNVVVTTVCEQATKPNYRFE